MRTRYDRTGRGKNAALFKFVFFFTFSHIVFTFTGDLVHFLVAVRSRMVAVQSDVAIIYI